ncbi:hypothetical protein TDB9533_03705 [Thalassocella blandensis]|nr:hypothetical protein TDB9533_03705 [Thalassocella blandensis]
MKKCCFCGIKCTNSNRAKEHIIPDHIQKRYGLPKLEINNSHSRIVKNDFAGGHISIYEPERRMTFSGFLAGAVCENCNNGWMSNLEKSVIPFIYELAEARLDVRELSPQQRSSLAKWAFKTASVLSDSVTAPQNKVLISHISEFYKSADRCVPNRVAVFAEQSSERDHLWSLSPTWMVSTDIDLPKELLGDLSRIAYKVFVQIEFLMLIVCYWPFNELHFTREPWGGEQLTSLEVYESQDINCLNYFGKKSEAFLMSIGVHLG